MNKKTLLKIKDLHTVFHSDEGEVKAVDGVDLQINDGEILALVGESGCGKSVTAFSILRLIKSPPGFIRSGEILFKGENLLKLDAESIRKIRGKEISMIYQEPMTSLNPLFRVGTQVVETIRLHFKKSKYEALEITERMFKEVGIPDPKKRMADYPHQMSGGLRQRVMIAMALVCQPRLMIADEPTTALDVSIQAQILELITTLVRERNASILLITHDLGAVAETADRVAVMYAGKIVEKAEVKQFFENPMHPYSLGLLKSIPDISIPVPNNKLLYAIPGMVPSLIDLKEGCAFENRCKKRMDKCFSENPPMFNCGNDHKVRCWIYER